MSFSTDQYDGLKSSYHHKMPPVYSDLSQLPRCLLMKACKLNRYCGIRTGWASYSHQSSELCVAEQVKLGLLVDLNVYRKDERHVTHDSVAGCRNGYVKL
jgi:hypothetical protein